MAEAAVEPGRPEETGAAPSEAPQGEARDESQGQQGDKGNLHERFRTDPDFAWEEYRKLQASKDRAYSQIEKGKLAFEIAEALGNGDVQTGSQEALNRLQFLQRALSDPTMSKILNHYSQTGKVPDQWDLEDGAGMESDDDEVSQLKRELSELRQTVTGLSGQTTEQSLRSHLKNFMENDKGRYLTPEERDQFFDFAESEIRKWTSNPQHQNMKLGEREVRLIALNFLDEKGLLEAIGERRHLEKLRKRGELETDVPSSVGPSSVSRVPPDSNFKSAAEAMRWARANLRDV